jgi:hypothetical protein
VTSFAIAPEPVVLRRDRAIPPLEAGMASMDVPFDQTTTEPYVKAAVVATPEYHTRSNGASFVWHWPVIVDRRVVVGQALTLQTYCPGKLRDYFKEKILDKLKFDDVLKR